MMSRHYQRSKTAVAVSLVCASLTLTGCGSKPKNEPPVVVVPPPVEQPGTFDALHGVWNELGYGAIIQITNDKVNVFQYNTSACIQTDTLNHQQAEALVDQIAKVGTDQMTLKREGQVIATYYQAQDALPETCIEPLEEGVELDAVVNFDYFWHTFNDYYAFFEQRGVNWQQMYDQYRPQITSTTSQDALFEVMSAMLEPLQDGHVAIEAQDMDFSVGKPIPLYKSILSSLMSSYRSDEPSTFGDIAAYYNQTFLDSQKGYVTEQSLGLYPQDSANPQLLWGKNEQNVGLLVINRMMFVEPGQAPEDVDFDTMITNLKSQMNTIMEQLKDTDGLILDIRNNDGGTDAVSLAIANYFADKDTLVFNKQALNKAGMGHEYSASLVKNDNAYAKPVYLLTSQRTASAAEIFTMAMTQLDHVVLVGEETSGALSDVLSLNMPNGWELSLSNEIYKDGQGQTFEVSGFTPDQPAPAFSFESLSNHSFETYQLALEQLGKAQQPQLSEQGFESQLNALMTQGLIPGVSVAVVKSGDIVYQKGFGRADETNRAVTEHTPFFMASVSKTVLGTTLAGAEADNKLSLDDKIQPLVDFQISYPNQSSPDEDNFDLSFRELVTHSSGIMDDDSTYQCTYFLTEDNSSLLNMATGEQTCDDNIDNDINHFLASYLDQDGEYYQSDNFTSNYDVDAGDVYVYSNIATGLAGHALEQKTGKTLPELSNNYLFGPLNMNDSRWSIEGIPADISSRYIIGDSGEAQPLPEYNAITYPDGGLISSAHDMAKFISAAMNGGKYQGEQVLAASAVEKMLSNQSDVAVAERGVGYFWVLDGDYFSHSGGDPGVMTLIWADTNKDVAIVLLTNGDSFDDNANEGFEQMQQLLKTFAHSL